MEEIRLSAARAYQRKWRAENKEKVKDYNRRYWTKKGLQQEATQN